MAPAARIQQRAGERRQPALRWLVAAGVVVVMCTAPARGGAATADHLYGARLLPTGEGWAAGAFGTILHTRDSGASWQPQASGVTEPLFSIDFADPRHGWAVGRAGLVVATTDGGVTWRRQASGTTNHLFKVVARGPRQAWAVGDWGTVLVTTDGGTTWQDRSLGRDVILNGMSWPDDAHGWIAGEAGAIFTTADGGATWTPRPSGVDKTFFAVAFVTPSRGWVVGLDGLILRTDDGGATWRVQHGDPTLAALEHVGFAEALGNPSLYDVAVADGYGIAVGENGSVFLSTDAGGHWRRTAGPTGADLRWLRGLSLGRDGHGIVVGANGLAAVVDGARLGGGRAAGEHAPESVD